MSENTVIYLTEVAPGLWDVTRHWMDDDMPELIPYRRSSLSFDAARTYAYSLSPAEYGVQLAPRQPTPPPPPLEICVTCGYAYHTGGDRLPEH